MKILPVFLSSLTMADKFSLSGEMLLRGLGTVFMVLIILWGILSLFNVIFGTQPKKSPETKKPVKPAAKQESAPVPQKEAVKQEPAFVPQKEATNAAPADDGALIAAITAAIETYRAEEGVFALPFRVVSFKRKSGSSGWNGNSAEN